MKLFKRYCFDYLFLYIATKYFRIKRYFNGEDKINVSLDQEKLKTQNLSTPNLSASLPQAPLGADPGESTNS